MKRKESIVGGERFGRLIVIKIIKKRPINNRKRHYLLCECECGNRKIINKENVLYGSTKSCGCLRKEPKKWTIDKVTKESLKYSTKEDFRNNSGGAFAAARHLGIFNKVCSHMEIKCHRYTKDELKNKASKFSTKKKFRKKYPNEYQSAWARGLLDEICSHMEILGNIYKRALYVFEYPDKSAYIGLTGNYEERYKQHMKSNKLLVRKAKIGGQIFKRFNIWYPAKIAAQKEIELIEKYRKNGWTILNKKTGGGLGGTKLIWTKEKCLKAAKKCKTKNEFCKKFGSAVSSARKKGWIKECHAVILLNRKEKHND